MRSALNDTEKGLIGSPVGRLAAHGPVDGSIHGRRDFLFRGRQAGALVQAHRDVSPELFLDRHRSLGRELEHASVQVRSKGHSVDPSPGSGRKG